MAMKKTPAKKTAKKSTKKALIQKISPFLWFNDNAEEAAKFYVSVFKNSRITRIARYNDAGPGPKGKVMVVEFMLDGQLFSAINGGPVYTITPAVSFVVNCASQAEVDYYWKALCAGGKESQCGWLIDKFGVSWQITPAMMIDFITGKDAAGASRAMRAMFGMKKLDIAKLKAAYEGK